jgi:small multidrug resistance pump
LNHKNFIQTRVEKRKRKHEIAAEYASLFYFLSLTLCHIPLGIFYAVWAGSGIVLVALVGWAFYHQGLDIAAL